MTRKEEIIKNIESLGYSFEEGDQKAISFSYKEFLFVIDFIAQNCLIYSLNGDDLCLPYETLTLFIELLGGKKYGD